MSQITSHVLDTTKGKPAEGIRVMLYKGGNAEWTEITEGITNADGRIPRLLPTDEPVEQGIYKIRFETNKIFVSITASKH